MFLSWLARPTVCSARLGWARPGSCQGSDRSCLSLRHPGERSPRWWDCSRTAAASHQNWLETSRNYIYEKEPAGGFKLTFVCIRQFDGVFVGNARKKEVGLFLFRNIFQRHLLALRWVVSLLVADWEILKIHKTSKRSRQAEEAGWQ